MSASNPHYVGVSHGPDGKHRVMFSYLAQGERDNLAKGHERSPYYVPTTVEGAESAWTDDRGRVFALYTWSAWREIENSRER